MTAIAISMAALSLGLMLMSISLNLKRIAEALEARNATQALDGEAGEPT